MIVQKFKATPKNLLLLNVGLILTAVGIHFFKNPNHFAIGGTSGISILLNALFPLLDLGIFMFITNGALVVVGFIFLGKDFGFWTIYSSFALSAYVWILGRLFPVTASLSGDMLLDLMWAIILPAAGSAIVFNLGASTGGTDIIAMILSKHTSIEIGKALLISDFAITVAAGFVFGVKTALYCMLALIIKGFALDSLIDGLNTRKQVTVISTHTSEIKEFIIQNLHRGATVFHAQGAYTGRDEEIILTVLSRRQALVLRNYIRSVDQKAFLSIVNSNETVGKGFMDL
ncbi:MAG: YitT family protein [Angelakisella sp.]